MLLLLSRFSRVRLCATPKTAAHQAPPSLGVSKKEHWSGLPFPSPMHESEKWKGSRSVVSNSSRPHGLQATRLLRPWDFPGKSTGVGCHCLLPYYMLGLKNKIGQDKGNWKFPVTGHSFEHSGQVDLIAMWLWARDWLIMGFPETLPSQWFHFGWAFSDF